MLERIIAEGASALGVPLPEGAAEMYRTYFQRLTEANRDFNLTAIESEEDAARLHFLDSIAVAGLAGLRGRTLADIGTGGGLPGLAIKIAVPETDLTVIDATEKKIDFLSRLTSELGLDCKCVAGRAEELGRAPEYRESFDFTVSRAVARLRVLAELCLPLTKVGGRFIAMKSGDCGGEVEEARAAVSALGGELSEIREYTVPGTEIRRRLVVVEKTAPTDARFPRRWAAIAKRAP